MSGCLAITTFDDKPSKLHNNLVKIFGSDKQGLERASAEYEYMKSNSFKEDVGFDWETLERIEIDGTRTKISSEEAINQKYINDQLEPNIIFRGDIAGVPRTDGSIRWVEVNALSQFNEAQITEIVNFAIFNAIGQIKGLQALDFEETIDIRIEDTFKEGSAFYSWGKENLNLTDADFAEVKKRMEDTLRAAQLKALDNDDLQQIEEEEGDEEGSEPKENRTSNDVVKIESFQINSKNTATANIKMLLSFIPEIESYEANEEGKLVPILKEGEITPVVFKDPGKLWRKLEDNISGIFTKNVGGEVESVYSQMMNVLYEMGQEDATIMYLHNMLKSERTDDYKRTQFAQAFLKQKLLFYTTEVSGGLGKVNYKFFNAGQATSKEQKLATLWETGAQSSPYYIKDTEAEKVYFKVDNSKISKDLEKVDQIVSKLVELSKNKVDTLTQEQRQTVKELLNRLGIPVFDMKDIVLDKVLKKTYEMTGATVFNEVKATRNLLSTYIKPALAVVGTQKSNNITNKSGDFVNPIKSNTLTKLFTEQQAKVDEDTSENTLMGAGNKMLWGFSLPTYIDITIHKLKTGFIQNEKGEWYNPFIDQLRALPYNTNSEWLKWLSIKSNADKFFAQTFNSFQKQDSNSQAVDNKGIQFFDQLADQMNKYLNGIKDNENSIYYTPTPADKGRLIAFQGPEVVSTSYSVNAKGAVTVLPSSKSVTQITGYFEDEYLRMTRVWNTVTSIQEGEEIPPLYVHYHLKKGQYVDKNGVPVGNGFKSQLFPELSPDYVTSNRPTEIEKLAEKLRSKLYDSENKMKPVGITQEVRTELNQFIAKVLTQRSRDLSRNLIRDGIFTKDEKTGTVKNAAIDDRIWKKYSDTAVHKSNPAISGAEIALKITTDYMINGMISNTEYGKVFSGDIAYFKDTIDYNKRIPATYTDGKYLAGLDKKEDLEFTVAVTQAIEIPARKLFMNKENPKGDTMEENFIYSLTQRAQYMDEKIRPTKEQIETQAYALAKQYENVNAADAQGWITLKRWKFLKSKLDGWSPKMEKVYQRMVDGTFTYDDLKYAAQPLKGVYFDRNNKTGVPTYLKYSQMVLIPGMWKGTSLEGLSEAMIEQGIDELITVDGVKSGALNPTKIHNEDSTILAKENLKFNTYKMSNLNWKLQQQLPVKKMKEDMDLGSQIMKNVISNIIPTAVYGQMDGQDLTGSDVISLVHQTISQLTNIAFKEVTNRLGTDEEGIIQNKTKFYRELAQQLQSKNMPSFIVDAIKRGYSLDAIPQVRYKSQNVISAMINNNVAKTITPGASMIQMSNVGVSKIDVDNTDKKKGIYMLKNVKSLKRPEIHVNASGKATVYSGQVFLPHSFVAKYIPNYRDLSLEDLMKKLDPKVLNLIGYRIPNQKMSSIQPLEVVGILPPSMGDAIMMYSEITMQTGSDFDIDKTYIMLPEFVGDEKEGTIRYISSKPNDKDKQGKKQLRNQLFELYNILLKSPLNYADMVSGIDGSSLKELIKTTHKRKEEGKKMTALKVVDPYYQLGIKFANSAGKSGVGLTANQMVDHVFTQIHNTKLIGENIGIGNITEDGSQDLSGIYDTQGKVITDTISMFLNAFVDIAKDPYITDGNFNDVTSNIVFFMIRSGVPLDFIVKFIGQPSFEEVTQTVLDSQSLIQEDKPLSVGEAIELIKSKYQTRLEELLKIQEAQPTEVSDLSKVSLGTLQAFIDNPDMNNIVFVQSQIKLLGHLKTIEETSQPLTELVLASKADVNGGGPDIAGHITGLSRFNKVVSEGLFSGIEERFAPNTMLGSKTQRTLEYLNKLDEQLYISATPGYKSIYTYFSVAKKGSAYTLDKKFIQELEKKVYAYAIGEVMQLTGKYGINPEELPTMFKSEGNKKSIADRVLRLQKEADLQNNALIQTLEIKEVKGFKIVSLDNFKNKPSSSLDVMQRGWRELFENPKYKDFATDLVKYAYVTSGFSRNRNSIYDVIPLNVSDDLNRSLVHYKDQNSLRDFNFSGFLENFLRTPEAIDFVTNLNSKTFGSLHKYGAVKDIAKFSKEVEDQIKKLNIQNNSVIFVTDGHYGDDRKDDALYKIKNSPIITVSSKDLITGNVQKTYYKNHGIVTIGESSYHLLAKTHTLGLNAPGLKIHEQQSRDDASFINTNNPQNYNGIKSFVEYIQNATIHNPFEGTSAVPTYEDKNKIRPSLEALENLTRREVMQRKCE